MAQYDINLREYWRILKKRKLVVILITIILSVFGITYAILRAPTPLYKTTCTIEFKKENTVEGLFATTVSLFESDDIATQISIIRSYPVFQEVAERMGLVPPGSTGEERQLESHVVAVIEDLQSRVEVAREQFTNILYITVTHVDPAFAQKLANTVALTYKAFHAEQQMKRIKEAVKYIDSQLRDVREKLRNAEEEFNRFTQSRELISIDLQSESLLSRSQEIQTEIRKLEEEKIEFESLLQRLKAFLSDPYRVDHDFYSTRGSVQYEKANEALVALILKRDTLLKNFTPKHPDVMAISNEIVENARKMAFLLQTQLKFLEKRESDLRADLDKVSGKTRVLMDQKLEFDRLKRKVDLYNEMTVLLERKNQEALIRRAEKPEEVNIVKPALLPSTPINPPNTVATGAMGVIIGLVLGLVVAFIVETFDTSLGAIEEVEETLGTQVLGIVPQADVHDVRATLEQKQEKRVGEHAIKYAVNLISHFSPKSMMAESFRALRTNLQFKDPDKKIKAIAVTSSSPEEGKTLIAANLAVTMAQGGMKTLLIGSDLRKPVLNRIFGVDKAPGLTDIILGNCPWRDAVKTVTDMIMGKISLDEIMITPGLDNLHIITSGAITPNPAELIDSQRLIEFIEEVKKEYDIVIFDSSPILSTADAAILAGRVDGVLLVYRVGAVSRGLLKRSATQLRQVQCQLVGVILNGMRPDVSPDFQDYKYYTYYYSYGEEGRGKKGRDKRGGFSLFKKKEDNYEATQEIWLKKQDTEAPEKQGKEPHKGRFFLMVVGFVFLAGGLLWQNNVLHPFWESNSKLPTKKDEVKVSSKKATPVKAPAPREPEPASEKALEVGMQKSQVGTITPGSRSTKLEPLGAVEKPDSSAIATTGEPSEEKGPNSSSAPFEGAVSPAEPERPAYGYEAALYASKALGRQKPPAQEQKAPTASALHEPEAQTLSYPYSLYLGSVPYPDQAEEEISRYRKRNVTAYWVKVILSKGTWYRIYTGYFQNRQDAESFKKEKGLKEAALQETPYANLIGVYDDSQTLGEKSQLLKSLGFSPYSLQDSEGRSKLYVGVFYPERRARRQYDDLKAKGIASRVVKR
ncbi:MAG: polysaccharide biosynthesis tyrosine autokinase [Deltaproteobacteria bacterium]